MRKELPGTMDRNTLLSICIPTYNRAEILRKSLEDLIPKVAPFGIPIFISDNASSDHTSEVVASFQTRYAYIYYSRNQENILENNFPKVLKMSSTRFSWLLADTEILLDGAVEKVLTAAADDDTCDLIIVNGGRRRKNETIVDGYVKNLPDTVYTDRSMLLAELGWYTTWISALVYGRRIVEKGNFQKYFGTDFIQLGGIYDYLAANPVNVRWFSTPLVVDSATEPSAYIGRMVTIFAVNWVEIIRSLPEVYSQEAKLVCIKSLDANIGIFFFSHLLYVRMISGYDLTIYRKIAENIPLITEKPKYYFWIAAVIPKWLIRSLVYLKRKL